MRIGEFSSDLFSFSLLKKEANTRTEHSAANDKTFSDRIFNQKSSFFVRSLLSPECKFSMRNERGMLWAVCVCSFMRNAGVWGERDSLAGRLHTSQPSRTSSCDSFTEIICITDTHSLMLSSRCEETSICTD